MYRIIAYFPRQSTGLDHHCFQALLQKISDIEETEQKIATKMKEFDNLSLDELRLNMSELMDFLKEFNLDSIDHKNGMITFAEGRIEFTKKSEDDLKTGENDILEEYGTTADHDWIDQRIGTDVLVVTENGETKMRYEDIHPEDLDKFRFGKKICGCKKPTKITFNSGFLGITCLESIQIVHDAHLWDLLASGVQFNWEGGDVTFVQWSDLIGLGINSGLLGTYVDRLCKCSHQIYDPTRVIF